MFQNRLVIKQQSSLIKVLEKQIATLKTAIQQHIDSKEEVKQKVDNICKIKGLGLLSVAVVLAETNGFALFENSRQLVSYAGYDIIENQSGRRTGRTRIFKKGNSRIRRILYMPAFNVIRYKQTPFLALYNRTLEKHGLKMKSYAAVQKKLLVVIYALWKNNKPYLLNYQQISLTGEEEKVSASLLGSKRAVTENTVAQPMAALHKVDLLSSDRSLSPLC